MSRPVTSGQPIPPSSTRLWRGFAIEQFLLVLCVLIIGLRVRSIEHQVRGMAEAREYSALVRAMETNVQGYTLALNALLRLNDLQSGREAADRSAALEKQLEDYRAFSASPAVVGKDGPAPSTQFLAEEFERRWHEMRQIGEQFLAAGPHAPAQPDLARFRTARLSLMAYLEGEMQSAATRLYDFRREAVMSEARAVVWLAVIMLVVSLLIGAIAGRGMIRAVLLNESKLLEQRQQLLTTLGSMGDAVITTDRRGRVAFLNGVAEALTGWQQLEAQGRSVEEVFAVMHARSRETLPNPVLRVLADGAAIEPSSDIILLSRDGTEWPIDDNAAPIRDGQGNIIGCVLIFRDISKQKQAEAALLASRERKALIVRTSLNPIVTFDASGKVLELNPAAEYLFGYPAGEVVNRNLTMLLPELYVGEIDGALANYLQRDQAQNAGKGLEVVGLCQDGSTLLLEVTVVSFQWNGAQLHSAFIRDISREKENEKRIYALLKELREADLRKDVFLATLAHELRNPLAPIRNMLEAMKRAESDLSVVHEARDMMERQMGQMVRLVDDLLDVSRITRNRLELRKERVELASVIHHAIEMCRPLLEAAGHDFALTLPPEPIFLEADPVRLSQVISNLLNNSCKYTPSGGGEIRLTVERGESEVVIRVKDNGHGVPAEMLPHIFEMFTQVDRTGDSSPGGLGIGLAIVKQLVELHAGHLEAFSAGPGQGSLFEVRLPILTGGAADLPASTVAVVPEAKPRNILVVDDNRDSAVSLALLLKFGGNDTFTAFDGLEAVAAAERHRPEIVLLDIGLPKLSGLDAARRIREQPWGRQMVLVAMTGWGQDEDRRKSKEAGFDHHMVKPLDIAALKRLLSEVVV